MEGIETNLKKQCLVKRLRNADQAEFILDKGPHTRCITNACASVWWGKIKGAVTRSTYKSAVQVRKVL